MRTKDTLFYGVYCITLPMAFKRKISQHSLLAFSFPPCPVISRAAGRLFFGVYQIRAPSVYLYCIMNKMQMERKSREKRIRQVCSRSTHLYHVPLIEEIEINTFTLALERVLIEYLVHI